MPTITLQTTVKAPIEKVFDLARNIDLHLLSSKGTEEEVVAGKKTGLMELNDTVTWKAIHAGVRQTLTSKMTRIDRPYFFEDQMLKGAFKSLAHAHYFKNFNEETIMVDVLSFSSPYGFMGKIFNVLYLKRHMANFVRHRNEVLKKVAESIETENS